MANQRNYNQENNFVSNALMGMGSIVSIVFIMLLFIKGNEISDLFYDFLGKIVEFIPYVVGAAIIYGFGCLRTLHKCQKKYADHEELILENERLEARLLKANNCRKEQKQKIMELREEVRTYRSKLNMSQIEDMPGSNGTIVPPPSDLQESNEEDI